MKRTPLQTHKPLHPRTREEALARAEKRDKPLKRLKPVSDKRRARHGVTRQQRAEIAAASRPAFDAPPTREVRHVSTAPKVIGETIEKARECVDERLLDAVRAMPCAFCGKPGPSDPHHVPSQAAVGVRDDRLTCPACRGAGTANCHDRAQQYEIPIEDQLDAVGATMALHVRAGRPLDDAGIQQALANVSVRWHRARIEGACYEALRGLAPSEIR